MNGTTSNVNPQSNTRQQACIYCEQTGHSSGDCPSQGTGYRSTHTHSHSTNLPGNMITEILSNISFQTLE